MESESVRTRGSSAERELRCAGAIGYDGPEINDAGDDAHLGTAVDAAMGVHVLGLNVDLEQVSRDHGVDYGRLVAAFSGGVAAWREISEWFPGEPQVQRRVSGKTTVGTADVVGIGDRVVVVDWKLGASGDQHVAQLKSYALAIYDEIGDATPFPIVAAEVHLLPATYYVHKFDQSTLEIFRADLERQHGHAGKQFSAGDWCKFCPRKHDCAPRDQHLLASAVAIATITGASDLAPRELLGSLYERSIQVSRALREYNHALRAALADGPIALGDGSEITLVEQTRDRLDATTSARVLELSGVDPSLALEITKSSIDRAIRGAAEDAKSRGDKINQSAIRRAVLQKIRDCGGVTTTTTKTIEVRNVSE